MFASRLSKYTRIIHPRFPLFSSHASFIEYVAFKLYQAIPIPFKMYLNCPHSFPRCTRRLVTVLHYSALVQYLFVSVETYRKHFIFWHICCQNSWRGAAMFFKLPLYGGFSFWWATFKDGVVFCNGTSSGMDTQEYQRRSFHSNYCFWSFSSLGGRRVMGPVENWAK